MAPGDVEALFHKQLPSEGEALQQERTELLQGVCEEFKGEVAGGQDLEPYVEKLANGSRDAAWRAPLGDSGILEFVLGILKEGNCSMELKIHSLRLIGNSCADTDANRERVVQVGAVTAIMALLSEPDLLPYVVAVLYNFMLDYAPAQEHASNSKLSSRLVDLISTPNIDSFQSQLSMICKLLSLLASQDAEPANANPDTPLTLLKLAQSPAIAEDPEDILSLVATSTEYLSHASLQPAFIASNGTPTFLALFETLHGGAYDPEGLDEDLANRITVLRKVLVNAAADLTDNPAFAETHPIGSPVFAQLRAWLASPNPSLQAAACLSLGNLSRSDEASLSLVDQGAHEPLVAALAATEDTLLLHSALSFLKNLSIPPRNRAILGPLLLAPQVLPRIWTLETLPQVQLAAASLTRLLAVGNSENARALVVPAEGGRTHLQGVLALFARADDPAKMEAARAAMAVLRTLATGDSGVDLDGFYEGHGDVKGALAHLLTQQRFPPLRSETLFVIGLLTSSSPPSIPTILSLFSSEEVLGVFKGAVAGSLPEVVEEENPLAVSEPRDPKSKEGAARADRENALVVVSRLLGAVGEDEQLKAELEGVLKEGGVVAKAN